MGHSADKVVNKTDFHVFHQKNIRLFYQLGLKFIDDIEVVRDIVQEAFIMVWQKLDSFENEEHMKAFLYTMIRNRSINYLRDRQVEQKNREKFWILQNQDSCRDLIIENELYDFLCKKIEMLSPMQKSVLWLHIDGYSNEEIARKLNISVNTVLTHKQRARAILRDYMGDSFYLLVFFMLI